MLLDATNGTELVRGEKGDHSVREMAIAPDGSLVVTVSGQDDTLRIWDGATGELLVTREYEDDDLLPDRLVFSPDGTVLAGVLDDGIVAFYDLESGRDYTQLEAGRDVDALAFSPDGTVLATGVDGMVRLWGVAAP